MNISLRINEMANRYADKKAVVLPRAQKDGSYQYDSLTFSQLAERMEKLAAGLCAQGFRPGQRVLLFVRPSLDFHALVFAFFKIGLVPILIDPGMGRKNLLRAIEQVGPEGLVAEPEVHFIKSFFKRSFKSIKIAVTSGRFPYWGAGKISKMLECEGHVPTYEWQADEMCALLFTSGGTGRPKGVVYTQTIFQEQTRILQELFNLTSEEVDLPGFPLFSLFTLSMGMTSVIPDMDASKPAKSDPRKLVQNIQDNKVTFVAGSPAIWKSVAAYCLEKNIQLNSVKYLVMFGAPVSNEMHLQFSQILPNGTTYTPYGATESLPVSNFSGKEILSETAALTDAGKGTCVGYPAPGISIKIIQVSDDAIKDISGAKELATGEIGEIIVKGKVVTAAYYEMPDETCKAKIKDGEGFWHRIGDMGYKDEHGRLWFCGRKAHRVETSETMLCSVNSEAIFNHHPLVEKTALVGLGKKGQQVPALVIQPKKMGKLNRPLIESELLSLGQNHPHTKDIQKFVYHKKFPVDVRHNIKIDRKKLAEYAARSLR